MLISDPPLRRILHDRRNLVHERFLAGYAVLCRLNCAEMVPEVRVSPGIELSLTEVSPQAWDFLSPGRFSRPPPHHVVSQTIQTLVRTFKDVRTSEVRFGVGP